MQISVFVPEYGTIEGITPAFRTFHTANEFLSAFGKQPIFKVEYVGLATYVPANSGEYTAETGLLDGKKCSTHWAHIEEFKEKYPNIEIEDGAVITEHENIYSSGGASSLWNLILYLVEKYSDRETAVLIAKYFALDISRDNQSQFAIFRGQRNHGDLDIQHAQDYIERKYEEKITVENLANHVNIGRRTFERRFKEATNNTPVEYLQRVRIEAAKKFFEASRKNVSEVMYDVGYTDTKAFRDIFRKITGLTPIDYRNKFAKVAADVAIEQ